MTCYNSELPIGPPGPTGPIGPPGPPGTGGGVSLAETLLIGNDTNGTDINLNTGDAIVLGNNSKIQEGTVDNGFSGGVSLICTNEKEQQWENGVRYLRQIGGTNVYAETLDDINPDSTYDNTKNWAIGSRYKNLVTGIEYICTDATTGAAVWVPLSGTWTPTFDSGTPGMSNVSSISAYYSSNGDIVTCSIRLTCDLDFSTFSDGSVQITNAPIATTTLSMIGCGSIRNALQANVVVYDNIIRIYSGSGATTSVDMIVNYQYEIN